MKHPNYLIIKINKTTETKLQRFLIDDLNKLEYYTNEIINNIYARNQQKTFAEDIEEIEKFLSYWKIHSHNLNK